MNTTFSFCVAFRWKNVTDLYFGSLVQGFIVCETFSAHYIEQRRQHTAEQTVQISKGKILNLCRILKFCRVVSLLMTVIKLQSVSSSTVYTELCYNNVCTLAVSFISILMVNSVTEHNERTVMQLEGIVLKA